MKSMYDSWDDQVTEKIQNDINALLSSLDTPEKWIHFIMAYASWNSCFGNGISALTAKIGSHSELFIDTSFPKIVSDRSNYIASFIFESAQDKFDDKFHSHRDSNRCLGQTTLMGMANFYQLDLTTLHEPLWLKHIHQNVMRGYLGATPFESISEASPGEVSLQIFQAMGYHWAAEKMTTLEFKLIHSALNEFDGNIFEALKDYKLGFAGGYHHGDTWFAQGNFHTHLKQAEDAIDLALAFSSINIISRGKQMVSRGISRMIQDHELLLRRIHTEIQQIS